MKTNSQARDAMDGKVWHDAFLYSKLQFKHSTISIVRVLMPNIIARTRMAAYLVFAAFM